MGNKIYPTDVTDAEAEAGFVVEEIDNPQKYGFEPTTIHAVICKVGPIDRIPKMESPDGQVTYKHQRYGKWAFEGGRQIRFT